MVNASRTLGEVIEKYINEEIPAITRRGAKREKGYVEKLFNNESFDKIKSKIKIYDLRENRDMGGELGGVMYDVLLGIRTSKSAAYKRYKAFIEYLNERYETTLDINEIVGPIPSPTRIDRMINILKSIQGEKNKKTKDDLADTEIIDKRHLNDDLNELATRGVKILNQHIKINYEEKDGNIYYSSTVHPVFLPLNLTEAYVLTVGLKKISKETEYESILNELADWIFSQLTPYGQDIIKNSIKAQGKYISFQESRNQYIREESLIEEMRHFRYVNLEKSQKTVKIEYTDSEGHLKTATGTIRLNRDKICLKKTRGEDILIKAEQIIRIEYIDEFDSKRRLK